MCGAAQGTYQIETETSCARKDDSRQNLFLLGERKELGDCVVDVDTALTCCSSPEAHPHVRTAVEVLTHPENGCIVVQETILVRRCAKTTISLQVFMASARHNTGETRRTKMARHILFCLEMWLSNVLNLAKPRSGQKQACKSLKPTNSNVRIERS